MIYFIQEGTGRGPTKIGYARDPDERRATLQAGNPRRLCVIATIPGDLSVERKLHKRFAEGNIGGEWFDPDTPGLDEFTSAALTFEAMWPGDDESPDILMVLDVIAPDPKLRGFYVRQCRKWQAQQPGQPLAFPSPLEAVREVGVL